MARIKKKGLDYFPMNTDFLQDRVVRRILKREGDGALAVLLGALSCIYAGEGYYVQADELFYDDLSDCMAQLLPEDVKRILHLAADYGLFDKRLLDQYSILTSVEIQQQFLFIKRRRKPSDLDPRYCLLDPEGDQNPDGQAPEEEEADPETAAKNAEQTVENPKKAGECPILATKTTPYIKQSKEKQSTAQQSTEKKTPPTEKEKPGKAVAGQTDEAYKEKLRTLSPPADGLQRNWEGLLRNLQLYGIPPGEQYSLILKTNFGLIGHPVWGGLAQLRNNGHNIRLPGRYLLSLCKD